MLPVLEPIRPIRAKSVPVGRGWLYEVKLDGFRKTSGVFAERRAMRTVSPQFLAYAIRY